VYNTTHLSGSHTYINPDIITGLKVETGIYVV